MSTDLQTIRTQTLQRAGLAADDARFTTAVLNDYVNQALRSLSSEHDWPWNEGTETITTVPGTSAYTPAATWSKTLRMRYEDRDLIPMQARDTASYFNDTGQPVGYWVENDKINIMPTPDGSYSIYHVYSGYEATLAGDTDTPALPDRYIDWLIWVVVKQVATTMRDSELYSLADKEVKSWRRRSNDESRRTFPTLVPKTRKDWWL